MTVETTFYRPPAPPRRSEAMTFARLLLNRRRDLLSLLPDSAYQVLMSKAPATKQPVWIVNHPKTVHEILVSRDAFYRKSDLLADGLRPLLREGMLISDGSTWARQHTLVAAAFGRQRLPATLARLAIAIEEMVTELKEMAPGTEVDLGALASRLSADALYRAIFARRPSAPDGRRLLDALAGVEQHIARLDLVQIFTRGSGTATEADAATREMATRLRDEIGRHVDFRIRSGAVEGNDILGALLTARLEGVPEGGGRGGLDRGEVIDQIATFFIAGHDTLAGMLMWALFLLGQQPDIADRIGAEGRKAGGEKPLGGSAVSGLTYSRQVLKEVLRLYPPTPFITRTAIEPHQIRKYDISPGDLVVISPWLIHRHNQFWTDPDAFNPDRFAPEFESKHKPGIFMPFGVGPRACIGGALSQFAGVLAIASVSRFFRFEVLDPGSVMPVCRMAIASEQPIRARIRRV